MEERRATYVDLLAWALAHAKRTDFTSDERKWQLFVYRAKEQAPNLFEFVYFDESLPDAPYSIQAEHARHVLTQAEMMSHPNLAHRVTVMNRKQKDLAKSLKPEARKTYASTIRRLAAVADDLLEPSNDSN